MVLKIRWNVQKSTEIYTSKICHRMRKQLNIYIWKEPVREKFKKVPFFSLL